MWLGFTTLHSLPELFLISPILAAALQRLELESQKKLASTGEIGFSRVQDFLAASSKRLLQASSSFNFSRACAFIIIGSGSGGMPNLVRMEVIEDMIIQWKKAQLSHAGIQRTFPVEILII
ncbi:hypothetical protein O6H91_19G070800 [Diphasiastrum complanatum]|uniref:Uncharacterized protein n=1 Tax=Diphasiastrum complanatum TaxID=34168 RepID=A0ACC2AWE1_DIPCM|nr:hypothetical protein O6H91_19G070800 [Diphasiastrum complanatum]